MTPAEREEARELVKLSVDELCDMPGTDALRGLLAVALTALDEKDAEIERLAGRLEWATNERNQAWADREQAEARVKELEGALIAAAPFVVPDYGPCFCSELSRTGGHYGHCLLIHGALSGKDGET